MRVLIVEDDTDLRSVLGRALQHGGYQVEEAADGARGEELASEGGFDAVILDWMLPILPGIEVCRRLRESGDTVPVVMLTARDPVVDRIRGLDAGADDYITKPFDIGELLARLRSAIRRSGLQRGAAYRAGSVVLDIAKQSLFIDEKNVPLSRREFELLELLMRNMDVLLSRSHLEEHVWGSHFKPGSNVLDVFVRRLRQKLGSATVIETVRGTGYVMRSRSATSR